MLNNYKIMSKTLCHNLINHVCIINNYQISKITIVIGCHGNTNLPYLIGIMYVVVVPFVNRRERKYFYLIKIQNCKISVIFMYTEIIKIRMEKKMIITIYRSDGEGLPDRHVL